MKVAIYARVSSKEQEKEGYSIPAQLRLLHKYALENGFEVVREFIDVETAKTAGRTQFKEMVKYFQGDGNVKAILVEKTDRLYRNFKDYVTLEDLDLEIHLVREGEVLSKDSRSHVKFIHGIKVLMAKNYIDNLSEEVKKGMREKAEQGEYPSHAPIGYVNNMETKKIEIDPERATLVKKLFEWYASGEYSLRDVRKKAIEEGLTYRKSKRPIYTSTLYDILRNPFYYGSFYWGGRLYEGSHQPLISKGLFDKVQEVLNGHNKPKGRKRDFAFKGLLTCAYCGCAITAEIKKGRYIYYHCTGNHGPCPKPFTREEVLEEKFGEVIKGIAIDDSTINLLVKALKESHKDEKAYHDKMILSLQAEYNRIQDRIDQAYTDKVDGKIPEELFLKKLKEWRAEGDSIMEKIKAHEKANTNYLIEGVKLLELANKGYSLYKKKDSHQKARLLKFVQSNSTWDGVNICPTYKKPFDLLSKGLQTKNWLPNSNDFDINIDLNMAYKVKRGYKGKKEFVYQ